MNMRHSDTLMYEHEIGILVALVHIRLSYAAMTFFFFFLAYAAHPLKVDRSFAPQTIRDSS